MERLFGRVGAGRKIYPCDVKKRTKRKREPKGGEKRRVWVGRMGGRKDLNPEFKERTPSSLKHIEDDFRLSGRSSDFYWERFQETGQGRGEGRKAGEWTGSRVGDRNRRKPSPGWAKGWGRD